MGLGCQVGKLLSSGGPHDRGPQPLWGLCSLPQRCYGCLPRTLLNQIQSVLESKLSCSLRRVGPYRTRQHQYKLRLTRLSQKLSYLSYIQPDGAYWCYQCTAKGMLSCVERPFLLSIDVVVTSSWVSVIWAFQLCFAVEKAFSCSADAGKTARCSDSCSMHSNKAVHSNTGDLHLLNVPQCLMLCAAHSAHALLFK